VPSSTTPPAASQPKTPADSARTADNPAAISDNPVQSNQNSDSKEPPYFGTWIIKKHIPTSNATALTAEAINDYIGKEIIVNKKQIVTSKGTIKDPVYSETIKTNTEFYSDWRISFSDLGLTDNTVKEIDVANYQHETEHGAGSTYILTSDNQLYTIIGGVLFELVNKDV
jgi:hypothetical protein